LQKNKLKWLVLTLAVIFFEIVMIQLGFWQLRRYHEKQLVLQQYQQNLKQQPISWQTFLGVRDKIFRRVTVDGYYLNEKTLLLDNRWNNGKLGYEVLTPFKIRLGMKILLVNRGWVPAWPERSRLPEIEPVKGLQQLTGYIVKPPAQGFMLGKNIDETTLRWPIRIQQININEIAGVTQLLFYPYVLRLDQANPSGFIRQWELVNITPARHFGYAIQWFLLSLVLLIGYLILWSRGKKDE